jgi:hypothetical protein
MEDSTAEGIVDARTAGGNETSSKVSRADALTADEREVLEHTAGFLHATAATALRKLLAASPVERPAAAPKPVVLEHVAVAEDGGRLRWMTGRKPRDCELYAAPDGCHAPFLYVAPQPAPAPAGERAAFEWPWLPLLPEAVITTADGEAVFTAHQMQGYANAYGEMVRARASSANETGAEGAPRYAEWLHLRTHGEWSDGVPAWARDHTGRMNDFTAATEVIEELAALASRAPAQAAEPVAYVCSASNDFAPIVRDKDAAQRLSDAHGDGKVVPLYAAPQPPAQADAREALTDEHAFALYMLARTTTDSERWIDELRKSVAANPEPRIVTGDYEIDHGTHVEIRPIYNEPQPRAEVTDDDIIAACDAHGITLPVEALGAATALVNHFAARVGDATC